MDRSGHRDSDRGRLPRGARLNEQEVAARLRAAGCVFAEDEARLLFAAGAEGLEELVDRRVAGEPLEVLLGWVDFAGRRLAVVPGVFVPRRRTELLARLAVAAVGPGEVMLELCCGVAPVAATVAHAEPGAEVHAADLDDRALTCARRNLPHGRTHRGDLYAALPGRLHAQVSVIAANAPYVPDAAVATMPAEARLHEPWQALAGGPDGTALQRRVVAAAPEWLRPGGVLLVETSETQAPATSAAMVDAGLRTRVERDEELDGWVAVGVRSGQIRSGQIRSGAPG